MKQSAISCVLCTANQKEETCNIILKKPMFFVTSYKRVKFKEKHCVSERDDVRLKIALVNEVKLSHFIMHVGKEFSFHFIAGFGFATTKGWQYTL